MPQDRLGDSFSSVLDAAQAGAGWAFERLWQAYAGPVRGYLAAQGATEPDDLTSEVFLGLLRALGSFRGDEAAFRSWLFTIAHRRIVDDRRKRSRRPLAEPLDEAEEAVGASVSAPAEGRAQEATDAEVLRRLATDRVRLLCQRLVPDQRDVLLLRLVGGFTVEEVAATVDKSPGAVKALQRRGLAAIRKILEQEGVPL